MFYESIRDRRFAIQLRCTICIKYKSAYAHCRLMHFMDPELGSRHRKKATETRNSVMVIFLLVLLSYQCNVYYRSIKSKRKKEEEKWIENRISNLVIFVSIFSGYFSFLPLLKVLKVRKILTSSMPTCIYRSVYLSSATETCSRFVRAVRTCAKFTSVPRDGSLRQAWDNMGLAMPGGPLKI